MLYSIFKRISIRFPGQLTVFELIIFIS